MTRESEEASEKEEESTEWGEKTGAKFQTWADD